MQLVSELANCPLIAIVGLRRTLMFLFTCGESLISFTIATGLVSWIMVRRGGKRVLRIVGKDLEQKENVEDDIIGPT